MSFNFKKIEKNNTSKDLSDFDENELENEIIEEEKINSINNYKINNNISSKIALEKNIDNQDDSLKNDKKDILNKSINNEVRNEDNNNEQNEFKEIKEQQHERDIKDGQNHSNNKNIDTQFYELTTNELVEKIKNDFEDIYISKQNDINKYIEKLANENSQLKLENSKLKQEIIKCRSQIQFNSHFNVSQNINQDSSKENNIIQKEMNILLVKAELEKKNIKEEYNYILNNISSNLITKNIKLLFEKLIKCKTDLLNSQKINFMIQQENENLKAENEKIKLDIQEEKNKIFEKIVEIQTKSNCEIDLIKNLIISNNELLNQKNNIEESQNEFNSDLDKPKNVYLHYIEKIKSLTYEKNKLLTCNYDFFIKINDLSQAIEEKNNLISSQIKTISSLESKIVDLESKISLLNSTNKDLSILLNENQEKINDISLEKKGNIVFEDKIIENKFNIIKRQQDNKISQLEQSLNNISEKNINLKKNLEEMEEKYDTLVNNSILKKDEIDKIKKEKNQIIKDINDLKTELKLKEEEIISQKNEYENKIKNIEENISNSFNNKTNIDIEQIQSLINDIYNKINSMNKNNLNNNNSNSNSINANISLFVMNNINDIAKLNEIKKQINIFYNDQQIYASVIEENEKLKNHIKEITNLTLERLNILYLDKFKEDFINISFKQLILKIINYIKVFKVCYLLQKVKTSTNFCEKYISWLISKDYFKNNTSSLNDIQSKLNMIEEEINNIKETLKNDSFEFDKKIKNLLSKDEVRIEVNKIQKKYEKIITEIFEYFLKYKTLKPNENNKEILTLQIPVKSYNLMIENNMNNLTLIGQSIDSWNLYINNDLNDNNNNVFQEIINITNIKNDLEYNNINEIFTNNNNDINNINNEEEKNSNNESLKNENDNYNSNNTNNDNKNENVSESNEKNNNNYSQYSFDNKD